MDRDKVRIAAELMRKGYDILKKSNQDHLRKSAYFLRLAMEKINAA